MTGILQNMYHVVHQPASFTARMGRWVIVSLLLILFLGPPSLLQADPAQEIMTKEQALQLGEDFGIIVGEVDEEIREFLGLEQAKGVVVFEVIGGKPAALAGIKPRALIKEINSVEVSTLKDFG